MRSEVADHRAEHLRRGSQSLFRGPDADACTRSASCCVSCASPGRTSTSTIAPPAGLGHPVERLPVEFTGIAIWRVREGRLAECWVERAAWEAYRALTD